MKKLMKKKIVITLERYQDEYISEMYGVVGRKKTDIVGRFSGSKKECMEHANNHAAIIELWMEQIS